MRLDSLIGTIQTEVDSVTEPQHEERALEQEFLAYGVMRFALMNPRRHSIKRDERLQIELPERCFREK